MLGIGRDLVFAARVLRRSRGFTIIAASSLALAIGANTTIFSVGKQLLFDRLDVPHALGRSRAAVDRGTGRELGTCTPRGPRTSDGRAST